MEQDPSKLPKVSPRAQSPAELARERKINAEVRRRLNNPTPAERAADAAESAKFFRENPDFLKPPTKG